MFWLLMLRPICLNGFMPTHQLVGPFHYSIDVYHLCVYVSSPATNWLNSHVMFYGKKKMHILPRKMKSGFINDADNTFERGRFTFLHYSLWTIYQLYLVPFLSVLKKKKKKNTIYKHFFPSLFFTESAVIYGLKQHGFQSSVCRDLYGFSLYIYLNSHSPVCSDSERREI